MVSSTGSTGTMGCIEQVLTDTSVETVWIVGDSIERCNTEDLYQCEAICHSIVVQWNWCEDFVGELNKSTHDVVFMERSGSSSTYSYNALAWFEHLSLDRILINYLGELPSLVRSTATNRKADDHNLSTLAWPPSSQQPAPGFGPGRLAQTTRHLLLHTFVACLQNPAGVSLSKDSTSAKACLLCCDWRVPWYPKLKGGSDSISSTLSSLLSSSFLLSETACLNSGWGFSCSSLSDTFFVRDISPPLGLPWRQKEVLVVRELVQLVTECLKANKKKKKEFTVSPFLECSIWQPLSCTTSPILVKVLCSMEAKHFMVIVTDAQISNFPSTIWGKSFRIIDLIVIQFHRTLKEMVLLLVQQCGIWHKWKCHTRPSWWYEHS